MKMYCVVPNYRKCDIESLGLAKQTSQPVESIVIEDDSEAESFHYKGNITIWRRKGRHYAAKNIWDGIEELKRRHVLNKTDVIIVFDGDDSLMHGDVIDIIKKQYKETNCWVTYGSYVNRSDFLEGKAIVRRGPYRSGECYRIARWRASHIKTFKYGLFNQLKKKHFQDEHGEWLKVCSDLALMFPLMEMAGEKKVAHIDKPLYVYNDMNDMNDHKVSGKLQKETEYWLRSLDPEDRVRTLGDDWSQKTKRW